MKIDFEVENKHLGKIFGKNGKNIKEIAKKNGVLIYISKNNIEDFKTITVKHFFSLEKLIKTKLDILLTCNNKDINLELLNFNTSKEYCSICLEELDKNKDYCVTKCSHKFHASCLNKSLQLNSSCPLCRRELEEFNCKKELTEDKMDELINDTIATGLNNNLFSGISFYFMGFENSSYIYNFLYGPLKYILQKTKYFLEN